MSGVNQVASEMSLLDRLDAVDRRLGLAPRSPKRPPGRLARWMATHPWTTALVPAFAFSISQAVASPLRDGTGPRLVFVGICLLGNGGHGRITAECRGSSPVRS